METHLVLLGVLCCLCRMLVLFGVPLRSCRVAELHPAAGKGIISYRMTAMNPAMLCCGALLFLSAQVVHSSSLQQKQQQQQWVLLTSRAPQAAA
jgi:hypothetical protein